MPRTVRQRIVGALAKMYFKVAGRRLRQELGGGDAGGSPQGEALLRRAAAEGAVLLENDKTLPLTRKFALFGRTQKDTFYSGYGSGGDVLSPYHVCILDGLIAANAPLSECVRAFYEDFSAREPARKGGWGDWDFSNPEPAVPEEILNRAAEETDTAVVVIGRASGEDRDLELEEGSYFLSRGERALLCAVEKKFQRVVLLLNIGGLIDLSFLDEFHFSAVLVLWQGGMEAGGAAADLLLGKVCPSGKLADAVPMSYSDLPTAAYYGSPARVEYKEDIYLGYRHFETFAQDRVRYPFGFGLSYTAFLVTARYLGGAVEYCVRNVGTTSGREVVQVYVQKPGDSPARELIAFHKTAPIPPGGEERGRIPLEKRLFASYDAALHAFAVGGDYALYVGTDVRSADMVSTFSLKREIVEQLSPIAPPPLEEISIPARTGSHTLSDVKRGEIGLEEFCAELGLDDLEALAYGALKMDSPLGAPGNAGVMGGVTPSLRARGVPAVTMTDGPSGIRMRAPCSLIPSATLLACSFDEELLTSVYALVGREMAKRGSHVLLAPGMNLHRTPLCGRNFEYFSEDPLLTGKLAAAAVRGIHSSGAAACPKHFCCNNREFNRSRSDSVLSERALRELYLAGFEICVKESRPRFLMTSYNKINGVYAHYHEALVRGVLRREWGFEGCVVTDWWMRRGKRGGLKNNAYRVRAGVNVLMPGGTYIGKGYQYGGLKGALRRGRLTQDELRKNACEVLRAILPFVTGEEDVVR